MMMVLGNSIKLQCCRLFC